VKNAWKKRWPGSPNRAAKDPPEGHGTARKTILGAGNRGAWRKTLGDDRPRSTPERDPGARLIPRRRRQGREDKYSKEKYWGNIGKKGQRLNRNPQKRGKVTVKKSSRELREPAGNLANAKKSAADKTVVKKTNDARGWVTENQVRANKFRKKKSVSLARLIPRQRGHAGEQRVQLRVRGGNWKRDAKKFLGLVTGRGHRCHQLPAGQ